MRLPRPACHRAILLAGLSTAFALLSASETPPEKKKPEDEVISLIPFEVSAGGTLGATPGGAKDLGYLRAGATRGEIPHPNTFTPEGLFSEHDLPLDLGGTSNALFRVQSAATRARFEVMPDVCYLAQLGLDSGIAADEWKRKPLNLVAVVDKSGSMSGHPLALVRASLKGALEHLRPGDQFSIVLYGDRAHVHLAPTVVGRATRSNIKAAIDAIASAGSTNMEAGLAVGYRVARETAPTFSGCTRVMLFTDERPNVGNTDAGSFMAMAKSAAADGIGLTTIGVGVQFGAELAARVSSVRGGNLFFFSSDDEMKKTFAEDFDTLVTELAHEFSVRLEPAPGLRLAGVFGVPADLLRWDGNAIVLDVATIFLSRRKGAIYFALAPDEAHGDLPPPVTKNGGALADVKFSYRQAVDNARIAGHATCRFIPAASAPIGLTRGTALVDEYLTLKKAAQLHLFANDQEAAFRLVDGLRIRLDTTHDRDLAPERKLVRNLHATLQRLSGHGAEAPERTEPNGATQMAPEVDDLSGLPIRHETAARAMLPVFHERE
jgi:Ca-activated chloride channel family protein